MNFNERGIVTLPTLEDANSIQVGLAEVMRLLVTNQIDHRTAALLLYALQTASANLKHTSFEPELPTLVVIDRECVERRPIGATAWSTVEGREYDDVEKKDLEKEDLEKKDGEGLPDPMARYLAERMRVYTESTGEEDESNSNDERNSSSAEALRLRSE